MALSFTKPFVFAPRLNPTMTGSSVPITVCWLPCCRTQGRLRLGPHLTRDPRGCFPAPRPQGDYKHCCSAARDVPGWSQINNSHPKGALAEQTHSWIYFKASQGRRALPRPLCSFAAGGSGCSTTKTCSNLEIFQLLFTDSEEPRSQWSQRACSSSTSMKGYSIYCIN